MIDTHTHLFSAKFDDDRAAAVQRALDAGVTRMYLPNIDAGTVDAMLVLAEAYPAHCLPMLGLHPTSVKADGDMDARLRVGSVYRWCCRRLSRRLAWLVGLLYIPSLWLFWAQGAKRCHDRGNSGWYQLIPFYFFVMLFGEGEPYENRFGPDPKVHLRFRAR